MTKETDFWARDLKAANAVTGADIETRGKEASITSSEQSAASSREARQRARAEFILQHGVAPEDVTANRTLPGDTQLTGEEYLATVDPSLAKQARMYIEGRRPFPTGAAMRNQRTQLAVDIAMQADPTLDAANAATRVATRKDFTSGQSSRNLTALNTAIGHLASLRKNAIALNNTWSPKINEPLNRFESEWMGDERVNNFNTVRDAFATELAKVFKGTGAPSLAEIEDWKKRANAAQSPKQLMGFVAEAADLLQSRIDAVGDTYNRGMSLSSDPITLLNPHAQEVYKTFRSETGVGGPTTGVFEQTPEGGRVAGEDIKGYRLTADQEGQLDAYLRSKDFTPEGYGKLSAQFAKEQTGAEPSPESVQSIMEGAKNVHDYYQKNPNAASVGVDYSEVDKAASESAGLGDTVAQTLRNAPESAYNLVTGVAAPVTDLARSLASGKREGFYEAVPNILGDITGLSDTGTANAFGSELKEKYGSLAGLKRATMRDPFGTAADISIPLTLGGTAIERFPGVLGETGQVASTGLKRLLRTGRAMDPLSGMVAAGSQGLPSLLRKYVPEGTRGLAGDVLAETTAFPSGVGGKVLQEGYGAGRTEGLAGAPTAPSRAFKETMRGGNTAGAVDIARDAVANLRDAATQRYNQAMQQFGKTPEPLSPDNLRQTMLDMRPGNYDAMANAPHRPADHVAWQQMNDTVEHYLKQAESDPNLLTPLAVDQFKQDLYSIGSKIGGATDRDAARIAGGTYRAVRKMLTDHDPVYANTMKDYADAAQEAAALESGFSLTSTRTKPVNTEAASRKLHSILRNNANTNYGLRAEQGQRLAQLDPTGALMPTLAGQSASSWAPRGMRGNVEAAGLLSEALTKGGPLALLSPKTLALLAPTSPRIMGELAYGAGKGVGTAQRVLGPTVSKAGTTVADLYNKYPRVALATSRADQYADETEMDRLRKRYGLDLELPALEGQ